ncbi:histidine phosphatase superfamily [Aspergillus similis]
MGKPRMIILIRHAQSEGNKNREIHQTIPDHRVKLTPEGHRQAKDAGTRLRGLLRPDDTIHFFTSPYRRTRETTEGILESLTADTPSPSPFPRHTIKVYEEPRLREQDFGNFQPCSAEMERMWLERADYGHFFYRIPNGESAADAYDRVSGFNESMWRLFGEKDFASVCVLVTHGLMTRVFLMKWYHWSVEYFEDLRNINHCEFVIMKLNEDSGKYVLQNQLRTWSELRMEKERERQQEQAAKGLPANSTPSETPVPIRRKWGGCPNGCNHGVSRMSYQRTSKTHSGDSRKEHDSHHKAAQDAPRNNQTSQSTNQSTDANTVNEGQTIEAPEPAIGDKAAEVPLKTLHPNAQYSSTPEPTTPTQPHNTKHHHHYQTSPKHLRDPLDQDHLHPNYNLIHLVGRDGGGTLSGAGSVAASEDENDNHRSHHHHHYKLHEPSRVGLKRHKPRPSQDLDNDGDDEGSGRQATKFRRTRSSHHRYVHPFPTPTEKTQTQTQTQDQTPAAERKAITRTTPNTGGETDKASPREQPSETPDATQERKALECMWQTGSEDEEGIESENVKTLEQAQKEDQSLRGSVY